MRVGLNESCRRVSLRVSRIIKAAVQLMYKFLSAHVMRILDSKGRPTTAGFDWVFLAGCTHSIAVVDNRSVIFQVYYYTHRVAIAVVLDYDCGNIWRQV